MLSGAEAVGYELGTILRAATYLFFAQLCFVCFLSSILPGSPVFWLLILYFMATVLTVANDLHFFDERFPDLLTQFIRTGIDYAVFFLFQGFLLTGDKGRPQRAQKIAKEFRDTFGSFSVILFITLLYLSNQAFMAAVRLIMNAGLTMYLLTKRTISLII